MNSKAKTSYKFGDNFNTHKLEISIPTLKLSKAIGIFPRIYYMMKLKDEKLTLGVTSSSNMSPPML